MKITTKKLAFGTYVVYVDGRAAGRLQEDGDQVLTFPGRRLAEDRNVQLGSVWGFYPACDRDQAVQDLAEDFTAALAKG
jgi:hypothetical protein